MDLGTIRRVWLPMVLGACALVAIFRSALAIHSALRWVGLVVCFIGLAGIIVARYTLGRSFSIKAKATELVTTGIYSRISNPIYVSGVICLSGVAIMVSHIYMLAILVLIIPMQILRARREARVLEEKFGEEYRQYRARTWF